MLIDWFTVAAQAINFLILVWLMKRFLYKPILRAIDAREKRIATELANAAAKKAEAQKERDEFQHKNEEFDKQRDALLAKAKEDAKAERQRLFDEARKAASDLSAKRQQSLRNDAHNLNQAIRRRTQQEVFDIARKTLKDLAGASLEERMVEVFVRRLREFQGEHRDSLATALGASRSPVIVRTAWELPAAQRAATTDAIQQLLGKDTPIDFTVSPDLVSGIELTANGQKVAWSIADYLAALQKGVEDLLKETDKAGTNTDQTPPPRQANSKSMKYGT